MAYIDKEKRIVVLFPHKTGTHTLRHVLFQAGKPVSRRYSDVGNHPPLDVVKSEHPFIPDLYEYEVYAFYREPIEKFLSFVAYNYRQNPLMQPYTNVFNYYETYGYFAPQTRWLKHHTTEIKLMDFRNFEGELRMLFSKLDIPTDIPIPRLNSGEKRLKPSDLTSEEIKFIKDLYKDDYEFFASKGITFPI